jgi:hypothetical protein
MAAAIDACYGGSEQANCPTAAAKLPQIYFLIISTRGVAKVNFFIYHTKWEAHVRKIRGVAERPSPSRGVVIFS